MLAIRLDKETMEKLASKHSPEVLQKILLQAAAHKEIMDILHTVADGQTTVILEILMGITAEFLNTYAREGNVQGLFDEYKTALEKIVLNYKQIPDMLKQWRGENVKASSNVVDEGEE